MTYRARSDSNGQPVSQNSEWMALVDDVVTEEANWISGSVWPGEIDNSRETFILPGSTEIYELLGTAPEWVEHVPYAKDDQPYSQYDPSDPRQYEGDYASFHGYWQGPLLSEVITPGITSSWGTTLATYSSWAFSLGFFQSTNPTPTTFTHVEAARGGAMGVMSMYLTPVGIENRPFRCVYRP